jgi:hypothetical protein
VEAESPPREGGDPKRAWDSGDIARRTTHHDRTENARSNRSRALILISALRVNSGSSGCCPSPNEIRPEIGRPGAAGLTYEQRLKIRESEVVRPSISADRDRMAAVVVGAVDQQAADAHFAHFTQTYFFRPFRQSLCSRLRQLALLERDLQESLDIHASQAKEAPAPTVSDRFFHGQRGACGLVLEPRRLVF